MNQLQINFGYRETSRLAYAEVKKNLNEKQNKVLSAIKVLGVCTDKQIARYLGWEINRTVPRRNERGNVNKNLALKDRVWNCINCGTLLNRDINAAVNIKKFALTNHSEERRVKNRNELPALAGVMTSEATFGGSQIQKQNEK